MGVEVIGHEHAVKRAGIPGKRGVQQDRIKMAEVNPDAARAAAA